MLLSLLGEQRRRTGRRAVNVSRKKFATQRLMDQKKFIVVARGGCHRYTLVVAKRIFRLKLVFGMVPLDESDRNNALRRALALLTPRAVRLLSSLKGRCCFLFTPQ